MMPETVTTTDEIVEQDMGFWKKFWMSNQGAILILCAQACNSGMDAIARFLQQGEHGMHAFQVMFARMSITLILSILYMWWTKVPDFPLGKANVRPLLILRSLFGFGGMYCLYYSIHYLPLAEATLFRFMVPLITDFACSLLLHHPFTQKELLLSIIALGGIVIIAHPTSVFGDSPSVKADSFAFAIQSTIDVRFNQIEAVNPAQRLLAIIVATLGIVGAAGSYTTVRAIGKRVHALQMVAYYAFFSSFGSLFFLSLFPGISFKIPHGIEWYLLLLLGILGFLVQFLLTKGLQLDSSSKATSMMYSQIVYAMVFDWFIWNVLPDQWGLIGGAVVVGSTLWSALSKSKVQSHKSNSEVIPDEESLLIGKSDKNQQRYT